MKINVSFDLDLADTDYDVENLTDLRFMVSGIGSLLAELQTQTAYQQLKIYADKNWTPEEKTLLIKRAEEKIKICNQIFDNYKLESVLPTGENFKFTHQEPGYKETAEINGEKVVLQDLH